MSNELQLAAHNQNGYEEVVNLVQSGQVDINAFHTEFGTPAVFFAAQNGSLKTLRYLIEEARANIHFPNLQNILYWAKDNTPDVLDYLTHPSFDLLERMQDGTTDLHIAAAKGDITKVQHIIQTEPSRINEKNHSGQTPLFWAAHYKRSDVMEWLMTHTAFLSCEDKDRFDPYFRSKVSKINYDDPKALSTSAVYLKRIVIKTPDDYYLLSNCYYAAAAALIKLSPHETMRSLKEAIVYAKQMKSNTPFQLNQKAIHLFNCYSSRLKCYIALNNPKKAMIAFKKAESATQSIQFFNDTVRIAMIDTYLNFIDLQIDLQRYIEASKYTAVVEKLVNDEEREITEAIQERKSILALKSALVQEAEKFGLTCFDVPEDGNCLFRALLDGCDSLKIQPPSDSNTESLRQIAVNHIRKYLDIYSPYITEAPAEYLLKMSQDKTWGDHLTMLAISRELNINIVTIQSDGQTPTIIKQPNAKHTLFLGYEVDRHYQSLHITGENVENNLQVLIDQAGLDDFEVLRNNVTVPTEDSAITTKRKKIEEQFAIRQGARMLITLFKPFIEDKSETKPSFQFTPPTFGNK